MDAATPGPDLPLLEMSAVTKTYGSGQAAMQALRGIDLTVRRGEFISVMGASGSGKSTCLNILGCLDTPSSGDYRLNGILVADLTRNQRALLRRYVLGFVFQGYNLLRRTTALENVELPLLYRRTPAKERRQLALAAVESVGLRGWEHHAVNELSGGQQQRIAIARAIVTRPSLLLADEPTGNLDSTSSHEIMELMTELNKARGITIIMVTHEADIAAHGDRFIQFVDGLIVRDHKNQQVA